MLILRHVAKLIKIQRMVAVAPRSLEPRDELPASWLPLMWLLCGAFIVCHLIVGIITID